jgi:hypothetical protein
VLPSLVILTVKVWRSPTCTVWGWTVLSTSKSTLRASCVPAAPPPGATSSAAIAASPPPPTPPTALCPTSPRGVRHGVLRSSSGRGWCPRPSLRFEGSVHPPGSKAHHPNG